MIEVTCSRLTGNRLLWFLLAGLAATTFLAAGGEARTPVGVTTASDGDPLGKPPNDNERILRIGIDVQANELVTTAARDRAHLVFLDGSSLTVGPNAHVVIDRFVYDPATNTGDLAISATRGVFRLVGGRISKQKPIVITTPSSTVGIRGGITIVMVTATETVASFVFGSSMTVTAGGQTQTATRAGSQVTTVAGGVPGIPTLLKQGQLGVALNQLEGAVANANSAPDQTAQRSGFSHHNSGLPANTGPVGPPNLSSNTLVNAVSNAGLESQTTNAAVSTAATANGAVSPVLPPGPPAPPPVPPPGPPPGPPRTSQTLTGFAAGLVEIEGGWHSTTHLPRKPGQVTITTDAVNNQASGTLVIRDLTGSHRYSTTATLQLGGIGGLGAGNSVFIDDKTYAMVTQTNDPTRLSTISRHGVTRPANDATVLASAAGLPLQGTPGACACEFLTWGWWASSIPQPGHSYRSYDAVGTYVAGKLTPAVQMPQTGSATYSGFMAGVASSQGNIYAAAGTYQNAWNFGTRSGVFNGTFDGRSYSGSTQAVVGSGGQTFTGSFSGGNRSGSLDGAFFSSPADAAKYQAGTFSIGSDGSRYKATGVFAGQR